MTNESDIPPLDWVTVENWCNAHLVGLDDTPGLLRFTRRGLVAYVGAETISVANFRRFVTPGGSWKSHSAGRLVHEHRQDLSLDYAVLHASPAEIERVRDALIRKYEPDFNYHDGHRDD